MKGLSKKLLTALLSAAAAVCLVLGLLLTVQENAYADAVTPDVTINADSGYLDIQDNVFVGLKDKDETDTLDKFLSGKTFAVVLPDTVTEIGNGVVAGGVQKSIVGAYSANLVKFTIPASVTKIGNYAFFGCSALNDITVPSNVKTIGDSAFQRCTSLSGVSYAADAKLESIGASAFSGCTSLTSITVPAGVKKIGTSAFEGCSLVTEVFYYAKDVAALLESPFKGIGNASVTIGQSGNEITQIPSYLFKDTKIKSVTFNNLNMTLETSIGVSAFENCTSLTTVTFTGTNTVKKLREAMFRGCTSLSSINLEGVSNLETIGEQTFQACGSLLTLSIPESVKTIDNSAFNGCTKLLEVKNDSALTITAGDNTGNGGIGRYAKNVYSSESGKSQFVKVDNFDFFYYTESGVTEALLVSYTGNADSLTLPASVTLDGNTYNSYKIYESAFKGNTSLKDITFSKAVSSIGASAFMGCTALLGVSIPSTVNEVGAGAFYGCTLLKSAGIEDKVTSLSVISSNLFAKCTSLESINIPMSVRTVGMSAFEGCTSLKTVSFSNDSSANLTRIESSAFKDCSNLVSIRIPKTVTTLGATVFSGCAKLEKAYLPDRLSSVQKDVFANCAQGLLLIAPDSATYQVYLNEQNFAQYEKTYEIEIELHVQGEAESTAEKAYFDVECELPVQKGYRSSVWYSEEAYLNKVDKTEFNRLLKDSATSKITLYANNIAKPEGITAKDNLNYLDSGMTISSSYMELFTNWEASYSGLYKVEAVRYYDVAGVEREVADKTRITDAGTYVLSVLIADEEKYGQWQEGVSVQVKISPAMITELGAFEWGVLSGNEINSLDPSNENDLVTIYVYDNKPYLEKQYKDSQNREEMDHEDDYAFTVYRSYLSLNSGKEYELRLKGDKEFGSNSKYIQSAVYSNNTGRNWAVYASTVTVTLDNNYRLPAGTGVENGMLKNQGITIDYDAITNKYVITKTWYIVTSDGNKLLSAGGPASYSISNWAYNFKGETPVTKPELLHGNIDELVSYTLKMYEEEWSDEVLAEFTFKHSNFGLYINGAMPAGYYTLSVSIKDCTYTAENGEEKTSTGTGISYGEDVPYIYTFTVEKANLNSLLKENGGYLDSYFDNDFISKSNTLYAEYTGSKTFGDTKSVMPILTLKPEEIHPISIRFNSAWGDEKFNKYYTQFVITYRIVGDAGNYGTEDEYTNAPYDIGRYGVNYNIYAPGYDDSFNDSSTSRQYTLYIQGVIGAPAVDIEYTGKTWVGKINFNSRFFEAVYLNDGDFKSESIRKELIAKNVAGVSEKDEYISAGTHRVVLMLNEDYRSLARWNSTELQVIEDGRYGTYAIFTFTINKATNYTTQKLQLKPWEWGSYDENTNIPRWSTQFVTEYNFMLVSKDGSKEYWYKPAEEQLGFDKADAGDYWLKPVASGTDSVKEFNTALSNSSDEWLEVTVIRAEISWSATAEPRIDSWKYGDDKNYTAPAGTLAAAFSGLQGTWTNYFCLYSDYVKILNGENGAKTYSDLKALQESGEEGFVPAGSYVYVYQLSATEDDNYRPWIHPVYFSVLKADNYWDMTPVIHDRNYGDENKLSDVNYKPHFGEVKNVVFEYWYIDENGAASPLPASVKGSELDIGKYEYKVTLKGSTNYDTLVFNDYFYVNKAENGWVDVPNMIGWGEGRYKQDNNAPVAQSKFGTVLFTVKDADGNAVSGLERLSASEINSEVLNSLGVGNYTLVAEVAGTTNYGELKAEAQFAVFEDSVGMTGLIAATIVFAVIAVGLAVVGIILLIRKNKKMEEEFRRMVNSEMNRR